MNFIFKLNITPQLDNDLIAFKLVKSNPQEMIQNTEFYDNTNNFQQILKSKCYKICDSNKMLIFTNKTSNEHKIDTLQNYLINKKNTTTPKCDNKISHEK